MNAAMILLAMAAPGIDYGCEPLNDGGYEYTLQIEPQWLERLRDGEEVTSEIPSWLNIRRYRVIIGNAKNLAKVRAPLAPADAFAEDSDTPSRQQREADRDSSRLPDERVAAAPLDEEAPGSLEPDPASEPLPGKKVGFDRRSDETSAADKKRNPNEARATSARQDNAADNEPRPWLPFVLAIFGLVVSLGGNVYLGWVAWGQRSRYWQMVERLRGAAELMPDVGWDEIAQVMVGRRKQSNSYLQSAVAKQFTRERRPTGISAC